MFTYSLFGLYRAHLAYLQSRYLPYLPGAHLHGTRHISYLPDDH